MTLESSSPGTRNTGRLHDRWFASLRVSDLLLWYGLSAGLVFVLPSLVRLGRTPWAAPAGEELQAWYWAGAFLIAAFGITLVRAHRGGLSIAWLGTLVITPWVLAAGALMLRSGIAHSRGVALLSGVIGATLLIAPAFVPDGARHLPRRATIGLVVAGLIGAFGIEASRPEPRRSTSTPLNSALIPMALHSETGLIADTLVPGGAIVTLGPGLLLATGTGLWYDVTWDRAADRLSVRRLSIPPPMRREVNIDRATHPVPLMRVTGLAADGSRDSATVYVAHEVWRPERRCVALQVSVIRLRGMVATDTVWRPIYETQPCLTPIDGFDPYESGGRLTIVADGALLLTVGDYGLNQDLATAAAQQAGSDYGKTLRIEPTGARTVFTLGHRNPGGLTLDRDGNAWVAEHGPQGGDEINLLRAGANYGWPWSTYGTEYGTYRWRVATPPGLSYVEPSFVFVPSVAISSLIEVRGRLFEPWSGDLLAGSLKAKKLLRLRRVGSRIVYAEPIDVGYRVRDLAEAEDGRIVMWTDAGALLWLAPASERFVGALTYEACARCHGLIVDPGTRTAPALGGIVGRSVASNGGFSFSDALKRVGGRWTVERLDAFLRDPAQFAPGTSMVFPGIADSVQRRAVLEFLRQSQRPVDGR